MFFRFVRASAIIAISICFWSALKAVEVEVPRWQPHDFEFSIDTIPSNPFQTDFSAEIVGPNGSSLKLPGFYDGNGEWKIRVSPTVEGQWTLLTHSDISALDNQRSAFLCISNPSNKVHGALRVDTEHPHQFVCEDGTRCFPMGYECDWLWALDAHDPQLKTINPFLDKLTEYGFNFVILNAYAHDTTWRKGHTGEDDFGPPPLYPWGGANDKPQYARFNLPYWQHYDHLLQALHERGIVAHILIKVYNKQVNWPAKGSAEEDLYFRWLIARYAAYSNVTWDLAKEAQHEKDVEYKIGRLRFIRANDPYHRLLTVHDDRTSYDRGTYDDLLDYRSDQQQSKWRETMLAHLDQHAWPVINAEFGYEHGPKGPKDKTYNVAQDSEEVCRRAWEICMAGGFAAYYYTYTAWDVVRPQDTPPGYAYFKHLHDFFECTSYWRMKPVEGITSDGYCLADLGHEYVVFLNVASPFTLKLQGLVGPLTVQWYQPFTGLVQNGGLVDNGNIELTPPPGWGRGPIVVHIKAPHS